MKRATKCQICGCVPQLVWYTRLWFYSFGDRLCIDCYNWSVRLLGNTNMVISTHE